MGGILADFNHTPHLASEGGERGLVQVRGVWVTVLAIRSRGTLFTAASAYFSLLPHAYGIPVPRGHKLRCVRDAPMSCGRGVFIQGEFVPPSQHNLLVGPGSAARIVSIPIFWPAARTASPASPASCCPMRLTLLTLMETHNVPKTINELTIEPKCPSLARRARYHPMWKERP